MAPKHLTAVILALALGAASPARAQDVRKLPQGWGDEIRNGFWFTSQGSQIVPYAWFLHLEDAASTAAFRRPEHMDALRYVTLTAAQNPANLNPDGLPIGFVKNRDPHDQSEWLGLTCAACHTNTIDVETTRYLVEGAPTLANFPRFFGELIAALEATDQDEAKFDRFAAAVLGPGHGSGAASDLHEQLQDVAETLAERQGVNTLPSPPYPPDYPGYGRLDAFANIMNQVVAVGLDDLHNGHLPSAPVSYPFLWGTPQSDFVQWNGSAPNTLFIGPMVRNVGEVVGVFGQVQIEPRRWWEAWKPLGYDSTIRMVALGQLEGWLSSLRAPRWRDTSLPPIDEALRARGQAVYEHNHRCSGCHQIVPEEAKYQAVMIPVEVVGTDPTMAANFAHNRAKTLRLEGTRNAIIVGPKFGDEASSFELVVNAVVGVMLRHPLQAVQGMQRSLDIAGGQPASVDSQAAGDSAAASEKQEAPAAVAAVAELKATFEREIEILIKRGDQSVPRYKARPLTGIWATAPYLHNGSVASLRELLLPADERSRTFSVGSRQFDPDSVGFRPEPVSDSTLFDVALPGNSNAGHEYANGLSDDDRRALLEYLKSL